jgi:hypothetical protein
MRRRDGRAIDSRRSPFARFSAAVKIRRAVWPCGAVTNPIMKSNQTHSKKSGKKLAFPKSYQGPCLRIFIYIEIFF